MAAKTGFGLAVLPCFMGDADPALVRAFVDDDWRYGLWLLIHRDLRQTARVRAFIDFIDEAIERHRDLFEGRRPAA